MSIYSMAYSRVMLVPYLVPPPPVRFSAPSKQTWSVPSSASTSQTVSRAGRWTRPDTSMVQVAQPLSSLRGRGMGPWLRT